MATAVASRFAVLSIDDDDDFSSKSKKQPKKKDDSKAKPGTSQQKAADLKKKNKTKKKTEVSNQQQQQSNGNGAKVKKTNNGNQKPKAKKPNDATEGQWEEWKKKDQEFVSDSYEQDLHEAVLQSKLEFEQQKKQRMALGEAGGQPPGGKGSKKKSKPQTISLEQFNNPKKEEEPPELDKEELSKEERLFFEQVNEDAQRAFLREQRLEQARLREPFLQEAITIAQYQDLLEKRDSEILELKTVVAKLQMDLQSVRERNAKLCSMLQEGEMKDKAKVLVEMERLQVMRQELVTEVQVLYTQLEQERSKVHALTAAADNSKKTKGKKKTVSECGQ